MSKWYWYPIWMIKRCIVMFMIGAYGTKNIINLLYSLTSHNVYVGAAVALISDILRLPPVRYAMFFALSNQLKGLIEMIRSFCFY